MIRHDTRRVSTGVRSIFTVLLVSVGTLLVPVAGATTTLCGATIVEDLTLDHDLTCAAGGLIVGADGIKINLQGHSITGARTGVGITVIGRTDVSIFGGTIADFFTGVLINNSADIVVKDALLSHNVDGVDVQAGSSGITIKASAFMNNTTRGIMLRGGITDNEIKNNTLIANRVGILVNGPTDTIVKDNTISGSLLAGIRVGIVATGNLVLDNTVSSNPAGIEFLVEDAGGASGNTFIDNAITLNTCGIKGPSSANRFKENQFSGNTADICPS